MEYSGCISSTKPSKYFSKDFLDSLLFKLIPDGYDICYYLFDDLADMIFIQFYLYDSTVPLKKNNS